MAVGYTVAVGMEIDATDASGFASVAAVAAADAFGLGSVKVLEEDCQAWP